MAIARDDFASLGAAPRLVTCPACTAFATTVFVQDSLGTRSKTSLGLKAVFSLGLSLLWSRDRPRCAWYSHYCGNCGLRLVLCDESGNRHYVESSQLIALHSKDGVARKIAPSPYSVSSLVVKDIPDVTARYRHLKPKFVFSVQFGGNPGVPSTIACTRGLGGAYKVDCPDLDWGGKFHVDYLIPKKRKKRRPVKTTWSHRRPSITISSSSGADSDRVTGLVQLSHQGWQIKLYTPKDTMGQNVAPEYESKTMAVDDESVFAPKLPYILWKSSKGHLLWTSRLAQDGAASAPTLEKRMVLVDSYDRLVAMELDYEQRPTKERYFQTTDRPKAPSSPRKLCLYGNLEQDMVEQVMTTYVAILAQMFRKACKDYEVLMETQEY